MSKGLIFDIRRFSVHDGPGIRTTVFFKGCPLKCWWCHNPESRMPEILTCSKEIRLDNHVFNKNESIGEWMTPEEVMTIVLRDRIFYQTSGGGVTFSGGEPLLQKDFLRSLLLLCKNENISTAVDTSGYTSTENLDEISELTDLFLYDLKMMDKEEHRKFTGVQNQKILFNLEHLLKTGKNVNLRIPLIPGINDVPSNIDAIIRFIIPYKEKIKNIDLLPYHHLGRSKYGRLKTEDKMGATEPMNTGRLLEIREVFQLNGLLTRSGG